MMIVSGVYRPDLAQCGIAPSETTNDPTPFMRLFIPLPPKLPSSPDIGLCRPTQVTPRQSGLKSVIKITRWRRELRMARYFDSQEF